MLEMPPRCEGYIIISRTVHVHVTFGSTKVRKYLRTFVSTKVLSKVRKYFRKYDIILSKVPSKVLYSTVSYLRNTFVPS